MGIFDVVSARLADGEVFDSAKLKNTVRFLIENDMRNVVIDLGNLEYLYSDTINAFIASNRHMLEVSGRIAILTEHPKVQDILKRAGLDNIMRIYRSEAEMIADSKEILRQTSSYRIEELQKISTQPEAPVIPKTEFDDFKAEMGQRLGSKLDNNELPQYQLGVPQNATAAPTNFPSEQSTSFPAYNQGFPAPAKAPEEPKPTYIQPQSTPAYNAYNPGQNFGGANATPTYPGQNAGFNQPQSNFDFPTVQLPVGQYGGTLSPPPNPAGGGYAPPDPGMGQNVWKSSGLTHYWNIKQPKPETRTEALIDSLMAANVATNDFAERKRTWTGIQNAVNEECFVEWLPTLIYKVPVRNRFGNIHPTVIPHRIIWNIDRVFVKSQARGA